MLHQQNVLQVENGNHLLEQLLFLPRFLQEILVLLIFSDNYPEVGSEELVDLGLDLLIFFPQNLLVGYHFVEEIHFLQVVPELADFEVGGLQITFLILPQQIESGLLQLLHDFPHHLFVLLDFLGDDVNVGQQETDLLVDLKNLEENRELVHEEADFELLVFPEHDIALELLVFLQVGYPEVPLLFELVEIILDLGQTRKV